MKKLIIVCEEKLRHYGDFLAQLMSSSDDSEGKVIGIKDGVAAAQVWTEKEYTANAAQISSEQYILFIGNSKMIKEKRFHMQKKYSEYGMNYGWLGKQGALFLDRVINNDEYEEFYKLASQIAIQGSQPEVLKLVESKEILADATKPLIEIEPTEEKVEITEETFEPEKDQKLQKQLLSLKNNAIVALNKLQVTGKKLQIKGKKFSDKLAINQKIRKIEEQEYTCLVLLFYLNDLGAFLGLGD